MNRARCLLQLGLLAAMTRTAVAQEGGAVGWDPVEPHASVEGTILGVVLWTVLIGFCTWSCLLFRNDWTSENPNSRMFGDLGRGPLTYSPSRAHPLSSALIPQRSWWEIVVFVAMVVIAVYALNHIFAGLMQPLNFQ